MHDSPEKLPFEIRPAPIGRYSLSVRTMLKFVGAAAIACALLAWLFNGVQAAREAARRAQCSCNFCGIAMALHNYHSTYGTLPPAFVADAKGRPMHSWRVLILPFLEHAALYNRYNFAEPWDGPGNGKLLGEMPSIFACPSRPRRGGLTSYAAISGPGTLFPGGDPTAFGQATDGLGSTLMVVEVSNVDIPWTSPRDLDACMMALRVNDPKRPGISSWHPGGANVTFGDAATRFLPDATSPRDLRALTTIDGHEVLSVDRILSGRPGLQASPGAGPAE